MTQIGDFNPFTPGTGQLPPYLAGRENEQGQFKQILANMAAGRSPGTDMVMYGPRGMGKTVLLGWVKDEVGKNNKHWKSRIKNNSIRTALKTPDELKTPTNMWSGLIKERQKVFSKTKFSKSGKGDTGVFSGGLKSESETEWAVTQSLVETLIKECRKNPLVFLLDEAHTMEPEQCRTLLNISQKVRQEAPFLLVLAGTPGLAHFLTTVGASFVERSHVIGIARLNAQATADAIVKPLNEHGINIDDSTLAHVVEDSQHYPYFIQLWGEALWDLAKEKDLQKLTAQDIAEAETKVESSRITFYKERRDTLEKKKLLPVSVAIATLFQQTETITKDTLIDIIVDNFSDDSIARDLANDHLFTLIRHEFVWAPPGTDLYEPGIPSLITYVLDKQREHVQKVSPAAE